MTISMVSQTTRRMTRSRHNRGQEERQEIVDAEGPTTAEKVTNERPEIWQEVNEHEVSDSEERRIFDDLSLQGERTSTSTQTQK